MAQALTAHCIDFGDWILKLLTSQVRSYVNCMHLLSIIRPGKFADEELKVTSWVIHFTTMELTPFSSLCDKRCDYECVH
jgi:hypothetical protein